MESLSSQSGDRVIDVSDTIGSKFVVDCLPLVVVIVLDVNCAMNNRLQHVHAEEKWYSREKKSGIVAREPYV